MDTLFISFFFFLYDHIYVWIFWIGLNWTFAIYLEKLSWLTLKISLYPSHHVFELPRPNRANFWNLRYLHSELCSRHLYGDWTDFSPSCQDGFVTVVWRFWAVGASPTCEPRSQIKLHLKTYHSAVKEGALEHHGANPSCNPRHIHSPLSINNLNQAPSQLETTKIGAFSLSSAGHKRNRSKTSGF